MVADMDDSLGCSAEMSDTPVVDARLALCAAHDWKTPLGGPTIVDIARKFELALRNVAKKQCCCANVCTCAAGIARAALKDSADKWER